MVAIMPLETVHLVRVFGRVRLNRPYVTIFGFVAAGRTEYSVTLPGRPRIDAGMTITAWLVEAGNWQTLVGWRDHASGEIICFDPAAERFGNIVLAIVLFGFAIAACWQPMLLALVVPMAIMLAQASCSIRQLRRARAALEALSLP